ncbi:MAG: N-methyl-L-tryptophan oxidase [Deltaproteobacteria bacterium]|nr:N-methyl-L-tryptophan oxidase [Deltaproteobacteria bacterium]MBI3293899.1 N-methyl-L-tryptophan oxidase [Deltaproteobacteria bacterium]
MGHFDTIVVGVGGMGSAACYQLARRGKTVLGIEAHTIAHDRGSSHGQTRLIRRAYFESSDYIPLLNRSYELWRQIEEESKTQLFVQNGLLMIGNPERGGEAIRGTLESAKAYQIPVERLSPAALRERFPRFSAAPDDIGAFEKGAGFLWVERAVEAHARRARELGAEIREGCQVLNLVASGNEVVVETDQGSHSGGSVVITAGPWSSQILADPELPLSVHRVVQCWFESSLTEIPCFAFDHPPHFLYGFPALPGLGLKAALHQPGPAVNDPGRVDRAIHAEDTEPLAALLHQRLPSVPNPVSRATTCLYTMTPDGHFIVDKHRIFPNTYFATGFSGHGFKFASVMGEILADLAISGETHLPIDFLRANRF